MVLDNIEIGLSSFLGLVVRYGALDYEVVGNGMD